MWKDLSTLSIKWKLILSEMLMAVTLLILLDIFILYSDHRDYKKNYILQVEAIAALLSANCIPAMHFYDFGTAQENLSTLASTDFITNAWIFNAADSLCATYSRPAFRSLPFPNNSAGVSKETGGKFWLLSEEISDDGNKLGSIHFRFKIPPLSQRIAESSFGAFLILIIGIIFSFILSFFSQRLISHPVLYLVNRIREITRTANYSVQLKKKSDDEIGELYEAFNMLFEQIDKRETERDIAENRLRELNEELEERVRLRTADLENAKIQAESANKAKSVFLANMSHEIRTPMNAILGFSQILLRDAGLNSEQLQGLKTINTSGEHLLALINDILEMSKIEAGKTEVRLNSFNLRNLIEELAVMFRVRTDAKNIRFSVEIDGNIPNVIRSDENKLRQIIINIIGNAVKFTTEGSIHFSVASDYKSADECILLFTISDTGPGVPEKDRDIIFRYFEQSDLAKNRRGGTGLGLAICREYTRMLGGKIRLKSKPGEGSEFSFTIAVEPCSDNKDPGISEQKLVRCLKDTGKTWRILVVDDRDTNREVLEKMLTPVGFTVKQVSNGKEAINQFKDWQPHLIFMDMFMPDMDGIEATEKIRAFPEYGNVFIVAVTASVLEDEKQKVLAAGVDAFIRKPFRETELFEVIRNLLHVEYIYEDHESEPGEITLPDNALSILPDRLFRDLKELVLLGDMQMLLKRITDIEQYDAVIAQKIKLMTKQFDFNGLMNLFNDNEEQVHE